MVLHSLFNSNLKGNKFMALFDNVSFYDWPFLHVCILQENIIFKL